MSTKKYLPQFFRIIPAQIQKLRKKITNMGSYIEKRLKRFKLPQFFQVITFTSLLILCGINIAYSFVPTESKEKALRASLLLTNDNRFLHEELGNYYLSVNGLAAKREYALAQELYSLESPSNLSPTMHFNTFLKRRTDLIADKVYWESLQEKNPEYLYANLKLAEINLRLGNYEVGKNYLKKAKSINPYDPNIFLLEKTW